MKHVLYLTRNGLLEPLGQSQILPYLYALSPDYKLSVISFEKPTDWRRKAELITLRQTLSSLNIHWIPLRFRSLHRIISSIYVFLQLSYALASLFITEGRPNLIHARSYPPAFVALLLKRIVGIPFLFDMRALWIEELLVSTSLRRGSFLHLILTQLEYLCLVESSSIISLTNSAVDYLKSRYTPDLVNQSFITIPTCADLDRFHPHDQIHSERITLGCVGTILSGWFLTDWLSSFFHVMAQLDSSATFEIISTQPRDLILQALNPDASLGKRLFVSSALSSQMPAIIQNHSASVMFFNGGLCKAGSCPTRMAEVLASGRPVVINPGIGDVAPIIRRHRVGVLATGPSTSEMSRCARDLITLLKDPDLSNRCRTTAELHFSQKKGASAYRKIYSTVLN